MIMSECCIHNTLSSNTSAEYFSLITYLPRGLRILSLDNAHKPIRVKKIQNSSNSSLNLYFYHQNITF